MRFFYLMILCCVLAGCTSSSRLANPLGLDLGPLLRMVDGARPVPVVYPAGVPQASLAETYGSQWEIMSHGYPPSTFNE